MTNTAKKNTFDTSTTRDDFDEAKKTTKKTTTTLGVAALAACAAMHCNDASAFADPSLGFLSGGSDHPNTMMMMMMMSHTDVSNEAISQTSMAGEDIPFWANMAKYARFSISIMVGFAYMFARPVAKLLKEPKTAALVVLAGYGGFEFIKFTITEMLAMNDPESLL